ncbi:hypothetical protein L3Q65_15155 [Amycolatopsis sp. FU40]|uniref:hypothetical protein n=1 Tax=Amycolatopsis sp. FU40 TaxID=2914159 RepID=UPI001F2DD8E1|nr:hypothetical protein [Amycolatopsis sp. FU40]UKD58006.1 hypothetical protein L3Q65_15155 [Amycolatopsis sp. FU40]
MTERQLPTAATGVTKLHRNHMTIVITDRVVLLEDSRVTAELARAQGAVLPVTERVVPIEHGQVAAEGTHAELVRTEAIYRTAVLS